MNPKELVVILRYEWTHGQTFTYHMITTALQHHYYQLGRWSWNSSHRGAHPGRVPFQSGQRTLSHTVSWYSGRTGGLLSFSVPSKWTLHLWWRWNVITPIQHILINMIMCDNTYSNVFQFHCTPTEECFNQDGWLEVPSLLSCSDGRGCRKVGATLINQP